VVALVEAVAFLLELAALAAYAVWGDDVAGIGPAIAVPVVVAVIWGAALSPRAPIRLAPAPKVALRLGVLLLSAVALGWAGHRGWAIALGAVVLADTVLLAALGRAVPGAH
jgi:Protein of unknown function (DUF2568)